MVEIIRKSLQHSTRNWRIQPGTAVTMPAKMTNYGKTEPSMSTTGKKLNEEENKRVNIHIWAPSGMIEPYCQWFKPPYQKHVRNKLSVFIILRDREAKKTGNGIWIRMQFLPQKPTRHSQAQTFDDRSPTMSEKKSKLKCFGSFKSNKMWDALCFHRPRNMVTSRLIMLPIVEQ